MKRIIKNLTLFLALIFATVCFAACDNGLTKGGSARGASDIEIGEPQYGFVKAEDYDAETFSIENSNNWSNLDVDTEYYLIMTFDVTSVQNNDGQSLLHVNITFDALDVMEGTMEEANTGNHQEMYFEDATTGRQGKVTTITFKISPSSAEPKTINMIIKLKPVQVGESHILIGFEYDPSTAVGSADDYKMNGSDGHTKNLRIRPVVIEAPVLSLGELSTLTWKNVKNADYYMFYETGVDTPIKDWDGEPLKVNAENFSVGADMAFNIGQYIYGLNSIVIRAFSNNPNITASSFSNSVTSTW